MKKVFTIIAMLLGIAASAQTKDTLLQNSLIKSSLFTLKEPNSLWTHRKTLYDVAIYSGSELVGYKKRDSAWVLINPDKTRIVLDSFSTRKPQ